MRWKEYSLAILLIIRYLPQLPSICFCIILTLLQAQWHPVVSEL